MESRLAVIRQRTHTGRPLGTARPTIGRRNVLSGKYRVAHFTRLFSNNEKRLRFLQPVQAQCDGSHLGKNNSLVSERRLRGRRGQSAACPDTAPLHSGRAGFELAKILHDHDVELVEFVLSEKKRFAFRREC